MTLHRLAHIMSRWRAALLLVYALAGCSGESMLNRIVRPKDDSYARAFFDSVRLGRIEYATQRLSPTLWQLPGVRDSLTLLATHLPHAALDSMHLVGASRFANAAVDRTTLTYEYHSARGWGWAAIDVLNERDIHYIDGIRADTLTGSFEAQNAFTLQGKSGGHYLMLVLLVATVGTAVTSVVKALRTPMRRRWLWALLALVGTGTFAFNWTTGQVGFSLLTVLFFNAAVMHAGPAAPWVLSVAFPSGALLTLRRVQQARTVIAIAPTVAAPVDASPVVTAPVDPFPGTDPESPAPLGND